MIHPIPGADGSYLRRRAHEVSTVPEIHFNDSSDYLFVLPMSHGRLRLRRGAETVHDGPVQPGVLRIVVPGERSAMAVQSTFESVMLTVPSATVRRAADELGARVPVPGTSAWSSVRPPHTDLYLLGKSMVGALTATDRRRTMLVEGLSVALLALVLDQGPTGPVAAPVRQLDDTQWSAAVEFADSSLRSGLDIDTWAAAVGCRHTSSSDGSVPARAARPTPGSSTAASIGPGSCCCDPGTVSLTSRSPVASTARAISPTRSVAAPEFRRAGGARSSGSQRPDSRR